MEVNETTIYSIEREEGQGVKEESRNAKENFLKLINFFAS